MNYRDAILKMYNDRTSYDTEAGTRHPQDAEKLVAASRLRLGDHVLDVATGTGLVAFAAAERVGEHGSVEAIDISEGLLEQARRKVDSGRGDHITFRLADAESLGFAPEQFNQIFCCEALVLFQDPIAVLRHWHSLLKPGGRISFTSTHEDSYFGDLLQDAVRIVLGPDAPLQMHGLLGTPQKIRHQLAAASFTGIEIAFEARGGYKSSESIKCTRNFLSVFFKGVPPVANLTDEQLGGVCGAFSERIAKVATPEGVWQNTGLFFVHARKATT